MSDKQEVVITSNLITCKHDMKYWNIKSVPN